MWAGDKGGERTGGNIGGRGFDLFFFFGSAVIGVAAGGLALAAPIIVVPLWWLWLFLVDGPHLAATFTRSYLDPANRRRLGATLLTSLLFLVPGPLALACGKLIHSPLPFDLFLLSATIWSFHHNIRQHFGIMSIYERHARTPSLARRMDAWFLYTMLWSINLLFIVNHPYNLRLLGLAETLPPAFAMLIRIAVGALALLTIAYVVSIVPRFRRGTARPAVFVLLCAVGASVFGLFFVGAFEPLIPHPENPEQQFLAVTVVGGLIHGIQYLGIVIATNRRRYAISGGPAATSAGTLAARLGRAPLAAYGIFVSISLIYLLLNAARGTAPAFSFFTGDSDAGRLFLALYWGVFFHHYYLDQKIWRPSRDPSLRAELGLAEIAKAA